MLRIVSSYDCVCPSVRLSHCGIISTKEELRARGFFSPNCSPKTSFRDVKMFKNSKSITSSQRDNFLQVPSLWNVENYTLLWLSVWQQHHVLLQSARSPLINRPMLPQASRAVASCYRSETVQASAKVTIEREHEVICDLSSGVICTDLEWFLTRVSKSLFFLKTNVSKTVYFRDNVMKSCFLPFHCCLTPRSWGTLCDINAIYTLQKSTFSGLQFRRWQYGSIVSETRKMSRNSQRIWPFSSSRSSKVIDLGVNRKPKCDFLLVIIVSLAISATVFEIFTRKHRKLPILPTPPLFDAAAQGEPLRISEWNLPRKN